MTKVQGLQLQLSVYQSQYQWFVVKNEKKGIAAHWINLCKPKKLFDLVVFCDLHKMSPKKGACFLHLLFYQCYPDSDENVWICIHFVLMQRQDRLKQHKNHLSVHLTDQSSWCCPHVFTVCYFTAVSIGSSSTTMELTNCSVLRLKPL